MAERIEQVKQKLRKSRDYLNAVLDQVGDRWEAQVYSDGLGWTVRQLVNHLAASDAGHNQQVMNIAEGRDIIPKDFDIERYNRRTTEKTLEKPAGQSREELQKSRDELVAWLDSQDESKLDVKGRHATLNIFSVAEILRLMAAHERGHATDIARALNITVHETLQ